MSGPPPPKLVPADVDAARASLSSLIDRVETTISRASSFTEEERNRRVNDEWSTVESLRHLVLIVDAWLSRSIKGEEDPFHPIALPPHFMPPKLPGSSIDPDARPSFDEACAVLGGRLETLREYTDALTPDELDRPIENFAKTVAGGLGVLFDEFAAHDFFMNRDLNEIEGSR
jgi:hypothetical protein